MRRLLPSEKKPHSFPCKGVYFTRFELPHFSPREKCRVSAHASYKMVFVISPGRPWPRTQIRPPLSRCKAVRVGIRGIKGTGWGGCRCGAVSARCRTVDVGQNKFRKVERLVVPNDVSTEDWLQRFRPLRIKRYVVNANSDIASALLTMISGGVGDFRVDVVINLRVFPHEPFIAFLEFHRQSCFFRRSTARLGCCNPACRGRIAFSPLPTS